MAERSVDTGLVRLDDEEAEAGDEATRVGELDTAKVQELMRQADVREATAVPPLKPAALPASGVVARGEPAARPGSAPALPPPVQGGGDRPTVRPKQHDPDARTVELGGDLVASVLRGDARDPGRADSSVLRAAGPTGASAVPAPFAAASEPPPRASMASLPAAPISASTPAKTGGLGSSLAIGVGVFVAITVPALYYLFVK